MDPFSEFFDALKTYQLILIIVIGVLIILNITCCLTLCCGKTKQQKGKDKEKLVEQQQASTDGPNFKPTENRKETAGSTVHYVDEDDEKAEIYVTKGYDPISATSPSGGPIATSTDENKTVEMQETIANLYKDQLE